MYVLMYVLICMYARRPQYTCHMHHTVHMNIILLSSQCRHAWTDQHACHILCTTCHMHITCDMHVTSTRHMYTSHVHACHVYMHVTCTCNIQVVERNKVMLEESHNTITMPSMIFLRVLSYLNRRRRSESHLTPVTTTTTYMSPLTPCSAR